MVGRGVLYWAAVWLLVALGLQGFYWLTYVAVALGGIVGLSEGAWEAPFAGAVSRAMFAVPALVACVMFVANWRDWVVARD